jgi:hypothetical protein
MIVGPNVAGRGGGVKDQSDCASSPNVVGTSNTVTGVGKGASKIARLRDSDR